MDEAISEMARRCYGYGRWDAPYWFIGPEQGQARQEKDDLILRFTAWLELGEPELSDCGKFHALIGEKAWHQEVPRLQPTWRPLMLLLMAFRGRSTDRENLRKYQREEWGVFDGETCVIELSGLPANSFKVPRERDLFRQERIKVIRQRMDEYKPELVVMYGLSETKHWERLAGCPFPPDNILAVESTIFALTPHPASRGLNDTYWMGLAERLRKAANHM